MSDNSAWTIAEKAKGTKDSDAPTDKSLVTPPGKQLTPVEVLAKSKENPEWVDEGNDEY